MPTKPRTGGESPRMRKLIVSIPEDLHKRLKIFAVEQDVTVKEFVTEAIEAALKKGGKRKE